MRYITYEIMTGGIYKVRIKPGKVIGFGVSYKNAVKNALIFESKGLFAVEEISHDDERKKYQTTIVRRYRHL